MNVVVLGGTKGMGRALVRKLAARGDRVFLLGRSAEDLERSVADLEVRRQDHQRCGTLNAGARI